MKKHTIRAKVLLSRSSNQRATDPATPGAIIPNESIRMDQTTPYRIIPKKIGQKSITKKYWTAAPPCFSFLYADR
jgi:hypothetical protein